MEIVINNKKFNLDIANTFYKRLIGLMGKKDIKKGMFFPKTRSIHTFFMKDNIDIIMIDKNNNIVYYEKNVKKNKIIIKKHAHGTIELPKNSLNNINNIKKVIINQTN